MSLSQNLLYLLLLYAVLSDGKLSLNTAVIIAAVIMLFNCFCQRSCPGNTTTTNSLDNFFSSINGI